MSLLELFLIALGLSMDAFAVAICKGLALKTASLKKCLLIAVWFGSFQAFMPFLGYLLGLRFQTAIITVDHWIAFLLLGLIGANMIREALKNNENENTDDDLRPKTMFILAVATAIDALAIGVTFAFLQVSIVSAAAIIGFTTFSLSLIGVKIGHIFGVRYKAKAEFIGGVILILLGTKILMEHLNIAVF